MAYAPLGPPKVPQVQWVLKYDGDAEPQLPQRARASPSHSPSSPVPPQSPSSPSVAAEGRGRVSETSPREERKAEPMLEDRNQSWDGNRKYQQFYRSQSLNFWC